MPHTMQIRNPIEFGYHCDWPVNGSLFHSHPFYEIYYFQEGECNYLIGDKLMALQPGDLILMHGMTLHSPNPSPHRPYVRSIVHFEPTYVHGLLQAEAANLLLRPFEELRNIRIPLRPADRAELEKLLADMAVCYKQRSGGDGPSSAIDRFDLRFLELLHRIAGWCAEPFRDREHRSHNEEHVQEVVTYLEEHYPENISLDDIADALHLTKPYLANLFKKVTGTTIFKYLYNRRINQAKILFRFDPGRSVSSVCREVGFTHLAHFSRLFKATVGSSPEEYRRRMAEGRPAERREREEAERPRDTRDMC